MISFASRAGMQIVLIAALAFAPFAAHADAPGRISESDRAEMADYLIEMLPAYTIFERTLAGLQSGGSKHLDDEQIACFRQNASRAELLKRKRTEVDAFADEHPEDFTTSLAVLRNGAGETLKLLGRQSIDRTYASQQAAPDNDKDAPPLDVSSIEPDKMMAFMSFVYEPSLRRVRELAGYGEFFGEEDQANPPFIELLESLTREISNTCGIPAEFFE